jgi:hypothetical protein
VSESVEQGAELCTVVETVERAEGEGGRVESDVEGRREVGEGTRDSGEER